MPKKKITKIPLITKAAIENQSLTRGKLIPIIEDLKDFIKSTSRGTEQVLHKEIESVRSELSLRLS